MPIRKENKSRYPKDWPKIRERILDRAKNCCEFCGVKNYEIGGRDRRGLWHKAQSKGEKLLRTEWPAAGEQWWCHDSNEKLRIVRIVLTIAHLNHIPEHCDDDNLKALCQRCHLTYDAKHHAHNAAITRHEKRGQLDMFGRK